MAKKILIFVLGVFLFFESHAQTYKDTAQLNALSGIILDCYAKKDFIPLKSFVKTDKNVEQSSFKKEVEHIKSEIIRCQKDSLLSVSTRLQLEVLINEYSSAKDYASLIPLMFKFFMIYSGRSINWHRGIIFNKFELNKWNNNYSYLKVYFNIDKSIYYLRFCVFKSADSWYLHEENATEVRLFIWNTLEKNWQKI